MNLTVRSVIKRVFAVVLAVAVVAGIGIAAPRPAQAASSYRMLNTTQEPLKCGSYYFKTDDQGVWVSKEKSDGYTFIDHAYECASNGTNVIIIVYSDSCYTLKSYNIKKKKLKSLKKFPKGSGMEPYSYHLSAAYKNNIYITRGSFDEFRVWTYRYDLTKKKLSKVKNDCDIVAANGKYVIAVSEYHTDASPYPTTLFQISHGKLKKIKKLTNGGFAFTSIGKHMYYVSYTDDYMKKAKLYRIKADGSAKKLLGTFKSSNEYGGVYVTDVKKTLCKLSIDGEPYQYTYKTKKLKKLDWDEI